MSSLFWQSRNRPIAEAIAAMGDAVNNANAPGPEAARGIDPAEAQERMDQLLLVCAAMWELLSEKAGLTENDLVARIAEIDARDGVADGKMTYSPVKCPQCQRTIFPKQQKCLYCGAARPLDNVFKSI
jgi:hypothetical protein